MMAGQIQEPFSFNFQADSVHSGSVSFGKFASEPLLWERRSSFSHNRILEEVERCSKHGIVTETRAYFEAQFKKKALRRQFSLDEQHKTHYEASVKENPATRNQNEYYELIKGNEKDTSCDTSDDTGYGEGYDYTQEAKGHVHFNENSDASNALEEVEILEGKNFQTPEHLKYLTSDGLEVKVKCDARTVTPVDEQTVFDCTSSRCNSVEVEVKQNMDGDACCVHEMYRAINLQATSGQAEKESDEVSGHRDQCPEITAITEASGTESYVNVSHTRRHGLPDAAKKSSRNLIRIGKHSVQETKTVKHSKTIPSTASKWPRSPNPRHPVTQSTSSTSKSLSRSKSDCKETRVIKATETQVAALAKGPPTTHQTPNRAEKVTASNISCLKTCPTSLRFREDVRAEKRREILTRIEQASHNRKGEINLNHARTQEKTANAIKTSRRSLNFKAKPMSSFCNEAERHELNSKDAVVNKPQKNPSNPRTKVVGRSSMHLKAEVGQSKAPSQVSMLTSFTGKKPLKTSIESSVAKKSIHPSSMITSASTKGNGKDAKMKTPTVPRNVEVVKGKGSTGTSNSVNERSIKYMTMKSTEKARPQEICRPAAKVY